MPQAPGAYTSVDASDGPVAIPIGDPADQPGVTIILCKGDSSANAVTITGPVFTTDDAAANPVPEIGSAVVVLKRLGDSATIFSDGTQWIVTDKPDSEVSPEVTPSDYALDAIQANTTAADLAALKVDFNLLLAHYRNFVAAVKSTGLMG